MNVSRKNLTLEASKKALQIRQEFDLRLGDPVSIYDLAEHLGVEVRFTDQLPSMEGMYIQQPNPQILISSLRPPGRQAFTCAHEIGHHVYGHGLHISKLKSNHAPLEHIQQDTDEFLVDQFAAFLLMPPTTVNHGFAIRGWNIKECTPIQAYTVAGWLGVGYTTLVYQMQGNLRLISPSHGTILLKASPKTIRTALQSVEVSDHLIMVDHYWKRRAIDLQVGDLVLLPQGSELEKPHQLQRLMDDPIGTLWRATKAGVGQVYTSDGEWVSFVRVSPKNFVGRSIFRHLEDAEDE